jgi:soluble lytic murein transglycosylase-like protein
MGADVMNLPAISPVLARIATIEARFAMPTSTVGAVPPTADFASTFATAAALTTTPTSTTASSSGTMARTMSATTAVTSNAWATSLDPSSPFANEYVAAGTRHGVPPELLSAVGWVESRYQTDAVSSAGAIGVMQIMPFVATELGVDPSDPVQAIDGAARLLKSHFDRFGSWDLALAAYNAGAGAVKRAGNAIPSQRVAEYVRRVNERMQIA